MAPTAKLFILLLLGVSFIGDEAAAQVSFDRTNWPLYAQEGVTDGTLEIELTEKPYQQTEKRWEYGSFVANAGGFDDESVPAAALLMQYLNRLREGNLDGISDFFVPGTDPEEVLRQQSREIWSGFTIAPGSQTPRRRRDYVRVFVFQRTSQRPERCSVFCLH